MLYGWLEVGLSNTLFNNEVDQDIIMRTIYNNKIIMGNTGAAGIDAAVYILGNNVGLRKVPDSNVALDVAGLAVLRSAQVGLSNTATALTINGDIVLKDKAKDFGTTMELRFANSNDAVEMQYNGTKRIKITDGVGIDLNDTVYITRDVYANAFQLTSDLRFKSNIVDTDPASDLAALQGIAVKDYEMAGAPGRTIKGFIAQEVESVFPQAIVERRGFTEDGAMINDVKTIDTNQILALNTSVIKSMLARIETLENTLEKYVQGNK